MKFIFISEKVLLENTKLSLNNFTRLLNNKASKLVDPYGEHVLNYTTDNGVEVTLTHDTYNVELNGIQVEGDIMIDYIGISDETKRGSGNASAELNRIINLADAHDMSLSLIVDHKGATKQANKTQKGLLNDKTLKSWYERKGFIFPKNYRYGYRPSKSESRSLFTQKTYTAKRGEVIITNHFSDPETFYYELKRGNLKNGAFYGNGDEEVYFIKDGKAYLVDNISYDYDWGKMEDIIKYK